QIQSLFKAPTWSVQELLHAPQSDVSIDKGSVRKILKLSGLKTDITEQEEERLAEALSTQMTFIKHLYEGSDAKERESSNDSIFRLLPSDHAHGKEVTLTSLLEEIKNLRADPEKGEDGFDVSKL
ncbi:uncharacterized protein CANTADRAFT_38264, partial [Suhomyces tanzawaensis NRRL Y-17324]